MSLSKPITTCLLVATFLGYSLQAYASSVPVRPGASDQLAPGPCYIFATIAAVESLVIQEIGKYFDLSEWYYYSSCAQGGAIGTGNLLMENTLSHIRGYGAPLESESVSFLSLDQCPNENRIGWQCYLQLGNDCCSPTHAYELEQGAAGGCTVRNFENSILLTRFDPKFAMSGGHFKEISLTGDRRQAIQGILDGEDNGGEKRGVIAFFRAGALTHGNEVRSVDHAIFFFGYRNGRWDYKDSWQGDAGLKTNVPDFEIDFTQMTGGFYLTADITDLYPPIPSTDPPCLTRITPNVSATYDGITYSNPFSDIDVCLDRPATIRVTNPEIVANCPDRLVWGVSGRSGSVTNSSTIQLTSSGAIASVEVLVPGSYTVWVQHRGLDNTLSPKRNVYLRYSSSSCGWALGPL